MSRRKTRCLTWGEERRSGEMLRDKDGRRVGHISFVTYVTLCGRRDDDPTEAGLHLDATRLPRPVGVCPSCWRVFREDVPGMYNESKELHFFHKLVAAP